jgi:hypothetical protein
VGGCTRRDLAGRGWGGGELGVGGSFRGSGDGDGRYGGAVEAGLVGGVGQVGLGSVQVCGVAGDGWCGVGG